MKTFRYLIATMAIIFTLSHITSCSQIDDLESRVSALEKAVNNLQSLINEGYVVSDYSQTADGWKLTMKNASGSSKTLNILNGKDGSDGKDGANGNDGANGKDGDSFFAKIEIGDSYVTITLTDGTVFIVPLQDTSVIGSIKDLKLIPGIWDLTSMPSTVILNQNYDGSKLTNVSMCPEFKIVPSSISGRLRESLGDLTFKAEISVRGMESVSVPANSIDVHGDTLSVCIEDFPSSMDNIINANTTIMISLSDKSGKEYISDFYVIYREVEEAVIYHGEKYRWDTSPSGSYLILAPLRYVPDGYTVSSDLSNTTAGVYYPVVEEDKGFAFGTSEEQIKQFGYLYQFETAMGLPLNKRQNFKEGVQGICPDGWHIPTKDEIEDMYGVELNNSNSYWWPIQTPGTLSGDFSSPQFLMRKRAFDWTSTAYSIDYIYSLDYYDTGEGDVKIALLPQNKSNAGSLRCIKKREW